MNRELHRRLDRLSDRVNPARMIVLSIAHDRADDEELIAATLAAAGIERAERDTVVVVCNFGSLGARSPCSVNSVSPMPLSARRVRH